MFLWNRVDDYRGQFMIQALSPSDMSINVFSFWYFIALLHVMRVKSNGYWLTHEQIRDTGRSLPYLSISLVALLKAP